jgi:hypothetical protein
MLGELLLRCTYFEPHAAHQSMASQQRNLYAILLARQHGIDNNSPAGTDPVKKVHDVHLLDAWAC